MSAKYVSLVLLTFLAFSSAAHAVSPACRAKENDITQQTINECAYQKWQMADKNLNIIYQKIITSLSSSDQLHLRQEQRKWVKQETARCKQMPEADADDGGSMWPSVFYPCLENTTKKRTTTLKKNYPTS